MANKAAKIIGGGLIGSMIGNGIGVAIGIGVLGAPIGAILLPAILLELDHRKSD